MSAANILRKLVYEGGSFYRTSLVRISFGVAIAGQINATIIRAGDTAIVSAPGHDLIEGALAVVDSANEADYNGAHVAFDVTSAGFKFKVSGTPASPATGSVTVASLSNGASVSASIAAADTGLAALSGGFLFVPDGPGVWNGVRTNAGNSAMSAPVHVFYDGDEEVVTRWVASAREPDILQITEPETYDPNNKGDWTGGAAGTHAHSTGEIKSIFVCQSTTCKLEYQESIMSGAGSMYQRTNSKSWGYTGPFDATVRGSLIHRGEAVTTAGETRVVENVYNNDYDLCESCYWVDPVSGVLRTTARSTILRRETHQKAEKILTRHTQQEGGSSFAIMLHEDREAIVMVQAKSLYSQMMDHHSNFEWGRVRQSETKIDANGQPFTDFDIPDAQLITAGDYMPLPVPEPSTGRTGWASLRAWGGYSQQGTLAFADDEFGDVQSKIFRPFLSYTINSPPVTSGLFFQRGARF